MLFVSDDGPPLGFAFPLNYSSSLNAQLLIRLAIIIISPLPSLFFFSPDSLPFFPFSLILSSLGFEKIFLFAKKEECLKYEC